MQRRNSLLIDVRYAIRQLSRHRCISRALDALERVEEELSKTPECGDANCPLCGGDPAAWCVHVPPEDAAELDRLAAKMEGGDV